MQFVTTLNTFPASSAGTMSVYPRSVHHETHSVVDLEQSWLRFTFFLSGLVEQAEDEPSEWDMAGGLL